jgi:putative membrane protein
LRLVAHRHSPSQEFNLKYHRSSLLAVLAAATSLAGCGASNQTMGGLLPAAAQAAESVSDRDQAFVAMVSQGGLFEVKAGSLAAEQGNTQDIRDQGATEAHDHELVGDKLKSICQAAGIPIADTLNEQFQKRLDGLRALSGSAFDAAYLREMDDIHRKDGAAFRVEAKQGSNPALRAFAAETHRIVLRHLGEVHAASAAKQ